MSVVRDGDTIRLSGHCGAQDAETLLGLIQHPAAPWVNIDGALHLHAAIVQVLMAFGPDLRLQPLSEAADPFLARWVAPLLGGPRDAAIMPP